jgi:hypothetical protein
LAGMNIWPARWTQGKKATTRLALYQIYVQKTVTPLSPGGGGFEEIDLSRLC